MDRMSLVEKTGRVERDRDRARAERPVPKLRGCAGCGGSFRGRDLHEVGDDNLALFEGDEVCEGCAADYGVS